jgi:glutathione synthase/RimK-type ligase-like ATP-grasp enzyme
VPVDLSTLAIPEGEIVVKPSVSGGGHLTARYEPHEHDAALAHAHDLVAAGRTAMVQPYEPRVDAEGETSVIYLGGTFSHAVHKDPMIRRGAGPLDNLIANQVMSDATATPAQVAVAGHALAVAEDLLGPTTYARVDLVETLDRGPALLELELLDPVLFFIHHPEGAVTLARLLASAVEAGYVPRNAQQDG